MFIHINLILEHVYEIKLRSLITFKSLLGFYSELLRFITRNTTNVFTLHLLKGLGNTTYPATATWKKKEQLILYLRITNYLSLM